MQQVKPLPATPSVPHECHFNPTCFTSYPGACSCTWKSKWTWFQYLGAYHPPGRNERSSEFLPSTWPSPGYLQPLASKHADQWQCAFSLLLPFSLSSPGQTCTHLLKKEEENGVKFLNLYAERAINSIFPTGSAYLSKELERMMGNSEGGPQR